MGCFEVGGKVFGYLIGGDMFHAAGEVLGFAGGEAEVLDEENLP